MRREETKPDVQTSGSTPREDMGEVAQMAIANGDAQQGDGKIDQIRNLLFGGKMQEVNDRFAQLEKGFQKETSNLRKDLFDRCDAIERYIKNELESLNKRLTTEQNTRSDMIGKLAREAKELGETFEKKTEQLAVQAADSHRELRESLLEQSKTLAEDIRQRYSDISAQLEEQLQNLRQAKTDRAALASIFGEMAMRLNHEGLPPELDR